MGQQEHDGEGRTPGAGADGPVRLTGVDLVRVLGVIAILAGHVWYTSDTVHLITYSWHVPVFFTLAGYLWADGRSLRGEFSRRWRSIIVPYIAWWFVVAVIYLIWASAKGFGFVGPLYYLSLAAWGGALAFRPFTAFWFFSAFVVAALFLRLVQGRPAAWAWAGALAAIVACHTFTQLALRSPLAVVQGLACALFILVGQQLRRVRPRLRRPGWTGAALALAGAALMALPSYKTLEIKSANFGTPVLSAAVACLLSAGMILVAERVTQGLGARAAIVLATVAAGATVTLLLHGVPMLLLETPRSGGWLDFVAVVALSGGAALLVARTRWAPWLSGRKQLR
jgi:fucose 4-O-acetylase-like acetyltransferase